MSTNTPPRKYGYTLPSLGGKGMGPRQGNELVTYIDSVRWAKSDIPGRYDPEAFYTRPIDCGPEHELVGEDEIPQCGDEYTRDGAVWKQCSQWGESIKEHNILADTNNFYLRALAVRRRKVVKDEWPKYWYSGASVYKSYRPHSKGLVFHNNSWVEQSQADKFDEVVAGYGWPEITPQRAFELTGDKSILEKGGDDMQPTTTGSPHPDVVQPSPEISQEKVGAKFHPSTPCCGYSAPITMPYPVYWNPFNKVVQCHNCGGVHLPANKLTQLPQPAPQWIPVSERLPERCQPFIRLDFNDNAWKRVPYPHGLANPSLLLDDYSNSFWYPIQLPNNPPPPKPQTQQAIDEDWVKRHIAGMILNEANVSDSLLEAIAYARGLDKTK